MGHPDCAATPLEGVKVVEIGTVITAPLAGRLLAELGAEVVKIERPDGGDTFRAFGVGFYSPIFQAYNKSKKSIVLDLKSAEGLDTLRSLIATTDVLLDNLRPGVVDRMGLTWESMSERNPRLIYCSITGFGRDGPYAKRPSFDTVALALSGIAASQLEPGNPRFTGPTVADNVTGMYATMGILSALYERESTGRGRRVEVNMLESSIAFIPDLFANHHAGLEPTPYTRAGLSQCYAGTCSDGKLLAIHLSSQNKFWTGLLAVLGRSELGDDPRFRTRTDRFHNYHELAKIIDAALKSRSRQEWMAILEGADVPFAPIHSIAECCNDQQARHLGTFHEATLADGLIDHSIRSPIWFDGKRMRPPSPAPRLGEHTVAVVAANRYGTNQLPVDSTAVAAAANREEQGERR
jgi:formyl-CoA transferase